MHKYLMSIERYFSGHEQFTFEAENKVDAISKAKALHWNDNYKPNTIKCIKKIKEV